MDWFLYDRDLRHERVNPLKPVFYLISILSILANNGDKAQPNKKTTDQKTANIETFHAMFIFKETNVFNKPYNKNTILMSETYSEPCQTYEMGFFAKTCNA